MCDHLCECEGIVDEAGPAVIPPGFLVSGGATTARERYTVSWRPIARDDSWNPSVAAIWLPALWDIHDRKHRPPPGVDWRKLIRESGEPDGVSIYHPAVTVGMQEGMELRWVSGGGQFLRESAGKRTFWMDLGMMIGAADGEETTFIFVEWAMSGTVHGRPMSLEGLRKKGAGL